MIYPFSRLFSYILWILPYYINSKEELIQNQQIFGIFTEIIAINAVKQHTNKNRKVDAFEIHNMKMVTKCKFLEPKT